MWLVCPTQQNIRCTYLKCSYYVFLWSNIFIYSIPQRYYKYMEIGPLLELNRSWMLADNESLCFIVADRYQFFQVICLC